MESVSRFVVTLFVLVLGTVAVGATVALGWNWFIRDELFPNVATMNVGVGVAIRSLFTVLTLHQWEEDDNPAIYGGIVALIVAGVASGVFLIVKLFLGDLS